LTGTLFVVVMVGCILWHHYSFIILFSLIVGAGLWEFYTLVEGAGIFPQKYLGFLTGLAFFVFITFYSSSVFIFALVYALVASVPVVFIFFFAELFRNKPTPMHNIGFTLLGMLYVVVPFSLLSSLLFEATSPTSWEFYYSPYKLLGLFILVWSNDTFAYLTGRTLGRTKLFERISPKKTWEGTIGGVVLTQGTAYVLSLYFTELSLLNWMVVGLIVSVTGTLGDLVESMFKRSLNVKDSGTLLPGHGGILDRFDGVLLSAPFVCTYLMLIR